MNSRVRRKKFLFYLTTTVDAELHFKIEPEVVVLERVSLFLFYNVSDGDKQIFSPFLGPDRLELIIFDIIGKKICNHPCRL